jgi:hypothetical protein
MAAPVTYSKTAVAGYLEDGRNDLMSWQGLNPFVELKATHLFRKCHSNIHLNPIEGETMMVPVSSGNNAKPVACYISMIVESSTIAAGGTDLFPIFKTKLETYLLFRHLRIIFLLAYTLLNAKYDSDFSAIIAGNLIRLSYLENGLLWRSSMEV